MAEIDYKALALQATAEGIRGGPNGMFYLAQAQAYWAAHNAEMQEALSTDLLRLTSVIDELTTALRQRPRE